jgi:hypothetical protein
MFEIISCTIVFNHTHTHTNCIIWSTLSLMLIMYHLSIKKHSCSIFLFFSWLFVKRPWLRLHKIVFVNQHFLQREPDILMFSHTPCKRLADMHNCKELFAKWAGASGHFMGNICLLNCRNLSCWLREGKEIQNKFICSTLTSW